MTYVSHTVRSLRRDPIPGETVRLVLALADEVPPDEPSTGEKSPDESSTSDKSPDESSAEDSSGESVGKSVAEAIESLGGEVVRELEFDRLLVEVEQTQLEAVCELDGVTTVETDAVLDYSP